MTTYPGPSTTLTTHRTVHPGGHARRPAPRTQLSAPACGDGDGRAGAMATPDVPGEPGSCTSAREASEGELAWWWRMEELRCRFERALTRELGRLGLSPSTYLALEQLALNPGQLRIAELAQEIRLSPSSTSRVVDRLVRDELAVRLPSTGDRRTVRGRITGRGRDLYEAAVPAYRMALAHALDASHGAPDAPCGC
ncbi:MarR family winged helix-turn-helix transcriptional regulator [Streptomyces sp. ISL-100]|uniref:MarR family winged helix-turn-helix transcriptional regulator n=1 Tax=Streptomyces sp. ISL-100 TaxID=2819173 RepID=UPI001BEA87CF|nr:MarR family transcriptional regulator [Streptomyces sp. ISL-100]MBT2399304.1 MarR family transcriptional regulator [Streptomyces sp. ISL-100]